MSYGLNVEMHKQVWYFCLFSGVLLQKVSTSKIDTHCHTFQVWSLFFFCLKLRISAGHFGVKFYHEAPINQTDTGLGATTPSFVTSQIFVVNFYELSTSLNL